MSRDDATPPADFLTLVMPLTARPGMTNADFYDYWLNAHVTLPARFPGITTVWLHAVSFEDAVWPRLPGVSHRPPPEDEFQGVPEATFAAEDGLAEFQGANKVQMDDGINFLQEIITYLSLGNASETVVDRTGVPAPGTPSRWPAYGGWPWPTSSGASEPAASSMTRSARCSSPPRPTCSSEGSGKELRRDLTSPPQCGRNGP